jgi:hypothetical protein
VAALLLAPAAQAAAASFPLTIATEGEGSGTIKCEVSPGPASSCAAEYPEGTEIAFLAEPEAGSEFLEWGGDCVGQPECELTIEGETLVTATFELEEVALEVSTEGEGLGEVECEVEGGSAEACEAEYPYGTEIAFLAEPEAGSEFLEWSEDCTGSGVCEVTMTEAKSVSALFDVAHFTLEVEFEGNGEGTVQCEVEGGSPEACESTYPEGTEVALLATPEAGSEFLEWSGECDNASGNECEVVMNADKTVEATFDLEPVLETLTVEVEGPGSLSAPEDIDCPGVCAGAYNFGEEVTLTATPDSGAELLEWSGSGAGTCAGTSTSTCEVEMTADKTVKAIFALEPTPEFKLTIVKAGTGSGSVTCDGGACAAEYPKGEEVTLAATAASGSTFAGFSGAGCSGTAPCVVTIEEEDVAVTATFTANAKPEETCATNAALCPPPPPPPAEVRCVVPKLAKKTLGQAKSALRAAHCALGKVTKPKKKGGALVVKSSKPGAGTSLAANAKVNLKLAPKPKKKK